jgi:hypothetical protein
MDWIDIAEVTTLAIAGCSIVATLLIGRRGSGVVPRILAISAAILCAMLAGCFVTHDLFDLPHRAVTPLGWWVWIATVVAVGIHVWDAHNTSVWPTLYMLGLTLLGLLLVLRDLSPGRFVVWTSICELTGYAIVTALVGWILCRFPRIADRLRIAHAATTPRLDWFHSVQFHGAQAGLILLSALLIAWILVDPAFNGMGEGIALLGLAGHRAANPAALMLLGATMLMAWQSAETWRARWQYAAFAAGLLFTTSLSWAGIEPGLADSWHRRVVALLISTAMMTFLTRFGLARALPRAGDWLVRARRTSWLLAAVVTLMAILALLHVAGLWT